MTIGILFRPDSVDVIERARDNVPSLLNIKLNYHQGGFPALTSVSFGGGIVQSISPLYPFSRIITTLVSFAKDLYLISFTSIIVHNLNLQHFLD
jgi:hypothetical protein